MSAAYFSRAGGSCGNLSSHLGRDVTLQRPCMTFPFLELTHTEVLSAVDDDRLRKTQCWSATQRSLGGENSVKSQVTARHYTTLLLQSRALYLAGSPADARSERPFFRVSIAPTQTASLRGRTLASPGQARKSPRILLPLRNSPDNGRRIACSRCSVLLRQHDGDDALSN
jgi:hypothetical protein